MKMNPILATCGFALAALFASSNSQAQSLSIVSGSACGGATSATFTPGGAAVTVSVCATAPVAVCGATVQLAASVATENDLFRLATRTRGAAFDTDNNAAYVFGANTITLPVNTQDLGATSGAAVPATAGVLLATFTISPQAGATASSYVIRAGGLSSLTSTATTCGAAVEVNSTPTFTLNALVAPTPTAPTASLAAGATLTGGSGSVAVTVATAGVATGSLGLVCTIPAGAASFAVTSGGTRTIAAPAALGANAPAVGLSCTPQAAAATATLSCAQTPNPAAALPALTSTITCPAAAAASITYTATPAVLTFAGVTAGTPTATQSVTVAANAANTGALNVASCAFGGANAADFSFSPAQTFPQSVAAGASAVLPVRFTPAAADSAARLATLTCQTPNATAAGATSFVVTLNGTNPAPVPIVITPTTPAGNVVLPALTIGATPAFVTTGLNFNVTGGGGTLTCVVTGAGYTATGSPLNLVVGTTRTLTVTYTGATAGTFTGTLTCTSTAPATGGPFVYNLSTTVQAAPAIGPTVQVPTIGTFGLGLLGLLIAGFAGWVQRRQVK